MGEDVFTTSAIGKFIEELSVGNTIPLFVVKIGLIADVEVDDVGGGEESNVVENEIVGAVDKISLFVDF